jgi:hypothetical protein
VLRDPKTAGKYRIVDILPCVSPTVLKDPKTGGKSYNRGYSTLGLLLRLETTNLQEINGIVDILP